MTDSNIPMDTSTNENTEDKSFDLKLTSSWLDGHVHLSIESNETVGIRVPCDICCVIDVSGSMGTEVQIQNDNKKERSGLSRLDVAKHALKTIINSLTENDRLSIVSFSSRASIVFELSSMDQQGRQLAFEKLEQLRSTGSTNLWDGLKTGLDILSSQQQQRTHCNVALFLLTDGEPTEIPPGGHSEALQQYKTQTNFTCSINSFGFGYSLDSQLLNELAIIGNSGSYAFIPDGSFVGTVFVNAISNLLTTVATNLRLSISNIDQTSIYISNYSKENSQHKFENENVLCFNLGSLIFGQKKNLILPMSFEQYENFEVILDYQSPFGQQNQQIKIVNKIQEDQKIFNQQKSRLEFVNFIREKLQYVLEKGKTFINNDPNIFNDLQILQENIEQISKDDEYLTDLLKDLTGQVKEAFSRGDWFTKWGKHYLPSLANAHLYELCNNFKDPGVQHYGQGQLFDSIRDEMDSIFCGLPPPVQSIVHPYSSSSTATTISMADLNNCDNPCFHGSCTVKLLDGTIKFVKDIQRGDQLYPHGGKVTYILQTMCRENQASMVLFDSGLIITPWHPIHLNGIQWVHPCSIHSPTNIICESVYSFALDKGHTVLVNDIECITLGHGLKDDVIRHNYYGTQRVIQDLRYLDSQQNSNGFIRIQTNAVQRNKRTGLVNRIQTDIIPIDS